MGACCPHCGVDDCEAKFDACLDRDFSDPEYGVVHHLMVGAYMMQHGRYTDENVQGMADFLLRHLDEPPSEATKREIRRWADGPYRVIRRAGESTRDTADVLWPLSIGDIDLTTADRYRTCVRRWAEAVARTARRNSPRSF